MRSHLQKIRDWMEKTGYEAVLLRTRANFAWVTGGGQNHILLSTPQGVADLIIFPERVVCVTSEMEVRRIAEEELTSRDVEFVTIKWTENADVAVNKLLSGKKVGSDLPIPGAEDISSALVTMRSVLDANQISQYREVGRITVEALENVAKKLVPGMTEHEIAALLHQDVSAHGARAIVALVSTDERIYRFRHPIPTGKVLKQHAMLVVCAEKYGLVGNATRFVHFGKPSDELRENVEKCAYIDAHMQAMTQPGHTLSDVFNEAIRVYESLGFPDEWRYLHLGGLTGYASREIFATPERHERIELNQAFAWNPALPGAKSEDTLLVTEDAPEILTRSIDWPIITMQVEGRRYDRPGLLVID